MRVAFSTGGGVSFAEKCSRCSHRARASRATARQETLYMRRVVVPEWHGVAARLRRRGTWSRLLKARAARAASRNSRSPTCRQDRMPDPRGDGSTAPTIRTSGWSQGAAQGRRVHHLSMCAATQAIEDSGWKPTGMRPGPYRRDDRSGIGDSKASPRPRSSSRRRGRRVSPFFIRAA